ncbi:MAG: V-type ATP synthase subunit F [Clostridia bacterium]|nr:V-type ATP synthase subunit F [Clostridia bacterium]
MHKVAVIGDRVSVCGFKSVGFETFFITDPDEAASLLRRLASDGFAVIFITEKLAAELGDEIDRYKDAVTPAVILIPGVTGNTGNGLSSVLRSIERAVGSQLAE